MAANLGKKRVCYKCGAKFYDLAKSVVVCPKCGTDQAKAPKDRAGKSSRRDDDEREEKEEKDDDDDEPDEPDDDDEDEEEDDGAGDHPADRDG